MIMKAGTLRFVIRNIHAFASRDIRGFAGRVIYAFAISDIHVFTNRYIHGFTIRDFFILWLCHSHTETFSAYATPIRNARVFASTLMLLQAGTFKLLQSGPVMFLPLLTSGTFMLLPFPYRDILCLRHSHQER